MNKPQFNHSNTIYTISWILTVPILIEISTACTLFSMWIAWVLFFLVALLSLIRIWHGFAQKCYKFSISLFSQLVLGFIVLGFFQLSFNNVFHTPFSHSLKPDIVEVANPVLVVDSTKNKPADPEKNHSEIKEKDLDDSHEKVNNSQYKIRRHDNR